MNNQDILMLLTYINSFDATITVDQARVLAWAELLPKHITYPQAKFSFKGASPFSSRHPRLNKGSPEVSK